MPRAKLIITLCLPALAFTALAPATSPAATAGWMTNGTMLTTTKAISTSSSVDQEFLMTAAGVTLACSSSNLKNINGMLVAPDKGTATSMVLLGCESRTAVCHISETIGVLPTTAEATLDGVLAVKEIIKPLDSSKLFATLKFEGAECALMGIDPITGQGSALGPTGQDERIAQEFISTTNAATGELKVASTGASVAGTALVRLATGEQWSFL